MTSIVAGLAGTLVSCAAAAADAAGSTPPVPPSPVVRRLEWAPAESGASLC